MTLAIAVTLLIALACALAYPEQTMDEKDEVVNKAAFAGKKKNVRGNPVHTFELLAWLEQKAGLTVTITNAAHKEYYTVEINHADPKTKTTDHYSSSNMFLAVALLGAAYEFIKNQPTSATPSY